jgi:GTP 3',8-cyclase
MTITPTYLRVVATTRCNYSCSYCHREGDYWQKGRPTELAKDLMDSCLCVAARMGVRKFKFLGGEPFLRQDLPELIRCIRSQSEDADISIITGGVASLDKLQRCWDAGLSRVNISIHGFTPEAFALRNRSKEAYHVRSQFIDTVVREKRAPLKLNYVYSNENDLDDLSKLLFWAGPHGLTVNILDNLSLELSWLSIADVVQKIIGIPQSIVESNDPDSLPTIHWLYSGGLRVEIKHKMLRDYAPYSICGTCHRISVCKEGIFALRLTHTGNLLPCMDRPEAGLPLSEILLNHNIEYAMGAWREFIQLLTSGSCHDGHQTHHCNDRPTWKRENNTRAIVGEATSVGIS